MMTKTEIIYPSYPLSLDTPEMLELFKHIFSEAPTGLLVKGVYIVVVPDEYPNPRLYFGRHHFYMDYWYSNVSDAILFTNAIDLLKQFEQFRLEFSGSGKYFGVFYENKVGYKVTIEPVYWNPMYVNHFEMIKEKKHY